jgi:hypothetical protein
MKILNYKISYLAIFILFSSYTCLLAIYAVKTVYYYTNGLAWWFYCALLTISFWYFVYHCFLLRPYWKLLSFFLSFFLGYIPLEVNLPWIADLVFSNKKNLSGFAEKLPYSLGLLMDILFYPALVFILLMISKVTLIRSTESKSASTD